MAHAHGAEIAIANESDDGLSWYERARLENIQRNQEELRRLGLQVKTQPALQTIPTWKRARPKRKRKVETQPTRKSKRLESKPAIDYAEEGQWNDAVSVSAESVEEKKMRKRSYIRRIILAVHFKTYSRN